MTSRLSLTVLVDNTSVTDHDLCGEAGLSFLLETAGKKILFDTGLSGLFLANAEKMGISLRDLDFLVLSHGHIDHTGGLPTLARHLAGAAPDGRPPRVPQLIAHPRCFWQKEKDGRKNGSAMSEEEVRRQFPASLSEKPVWITDDLVFLGEIPRRFAFEQGDPEKRTIHRPDGTIEPDHLPDDTALAFRSAEGLVIITGCSHAGICNITEYAREVCGEPHVSRYHRRAPPAHHRLQNRLQRRENISTAFTSMPCMPVTAHRFRQNSPLRSIARCRKLVSG